MTGSVDVLLNARYASFAAGMGTALGADVLGGAVPGVLVVVAGLLAGSCGLYLLHERIPHEHFHTGRAGPEAEHVWRIWLFVIAISLHNFPKAWRSGSASPTATSARRHPVAHGRVRADAAARRGHRMTARAAAEKAGTVSAPPHRTLARS